jgi:uncharacterized protein
MTVLTWVLVIFLVAAGLLGLILPALPGPLLLFAGLLVAAWAEDFAFVGAGTLVGLGLMALLAFLVDFVAGALGARRYGASPRAFIGATLGALIGIFFGLPGLLFGPFLGAVVGELSARPDLQAAGRAGWGAMIGLVLGTAAKIALGFAMIGVFLAVRFL